MDDNYVCPDPIRSHKMKIINGWISVEDRIPDIFAGKFRVRLLNGDELDSFFYHDAVAWSAFYGQKTGHWWNAKGNHERLEPVTHWMPLPEPPHE